MVLSATLPALTPEFAVVNTPVNADGPAVANETSGESSGYGNGPACTENPAASDDGKRIPRMRQNPGRDEPPPPAIGTAWPSMGWRRHAFCQDTDPELFFPEGTSGYAERQATQAKAICRPCTVRADCLSWALDTGQDVGVWGGLSERERRALRATEDPSGVGGSCRGIQHTQTGGLSAVDTPAVDTPAFGAKGRRRCRSQPSAAGPSENRRPS